MKASFSIPSLCAALGLASALSAQANLLRNPGFETVPGTVTGQGILPSDWTTVSGSPDTYSNDGSYGLGPSTGGNFTGVTAQEGIRWVAGWDLAGERFGQMLSSPLVGGAAYELDAALIQARRSDLDVRGGYRVFLAPSSVAAGTNSVLLGTLGPTTDSDSWEAASLNFNAPANASDLPFLYFAPYTEGTFFGLAYPGLDELVLDRPVVNGVPDESSGLMLLGIGAGGVVWARRRRQA